MSAAPGHVYWRRRLEVRPNPIQTEPILVRIHSQCLTGDIFEAGCAICAPTAPGDGPGQPAQGVVCTCARKAAASSAAQAAAYQLQQQEGLDT